MAGTIMIVEDEPAVARGVQIALEREGYSTAIVGTGEEAIKQFADVAPDLILLDVRLPGINGIELLKLLNQDRQVREVPVLFCSGATELLEENHDAIEKSGAKVVTKPFTLDGLIESVHQTLAQGQRHPDGAT